MDGEAEVFAGLFGDGGDRGDRRAGVLQDDVLDVLRPDGGKAVTAPDPMAAPAVVSPIDVRNLRRPNAPGVWLICVSSWLLSGERLIHRHRRHFILRMLHRTISYWDCREQYLQIRLKYRLLPN